MKKLISVLLVIMLSVNIFGIIAAAEMDNNWHYVPPGTDEQMLQSYEDLEAISAKYLKGLIGNDNLTDVQKILIIHDRIIESCEYDLTYTKRYATHTLIDGCSVCTGYSYAFRFLLDKIGIKSTLETSDVMNHLWNVVYLDGKKYYVDLTYDDPSYDMSGNVLHKNFLISSARFSQTHGGVNDFDDSLKDTRYQDQYWVNSNTAFQLIGNDIYYIDNTNSKLMKVGSSTPLLSLTKDWKISATSYYPGNFSRLASDGYNLYFSDDNSIYKYDVKTKAKTEVYTLGASFSKYDNIYGFTFKDCELIFEACHDLNWTESTKHTIQKRVAVDHYYKNSDLQSDLSSHWQECLVCGHKNNIEAHNFISGYKSDETHHWLVCSKCNVKKDIQEHVYSDDCDTSCDLCGFLRTAPHYPNGEWYSNNSQHWHQCGNCGQKYGLADHNWNSGTVIQEATCTSQGSGKFTCIDCGKEEIVPIQNKLHTEVIDPAVQVTCSTDGKTEGKHCSVCNTIIVPQTVIPATGHSIVTVAKVDPTCTKTGMTEWSHCENCDYIEVSPEVIPAKGHNYNLSWSGDTNSHWHECSDCGAKKDVTSHTWDSGVITKDPTCSSSGIRTYTCSVCKRTKNEFPQKLDHTLAIDEGQPATCTSFGFTEGYHCAVCNEIIKAQELIHAKGHTILGGWLYDDTAHWHKCAVCKVDFDKHNHWYDNDCDTTCNDCGKERTITHKYNDKFSSDASNHWKECSVCGDRIEQAGHTSDSGTLTKATLTKSGKKVYKCKVCSKVIDSKTIAYPKTIKLSATSYTYDGKVKKPTVTVKDSAGKKIGTGSYNVSYASGRKAVGSYKVTVKFKGNYSGTKTLTFKINPKNTTLSKPTSPKKKQIKVTWKKYKTQTTGYQIQYSTSKSFKSGNKTVTVSKNTTVSALIKNLKSNKTYYVRIRTYKTVGKTKYYSAWSKSKYAKCK